MAVIKVKITALLFVDTTDLHRFDRVLVALEFAATLGSHHVVTVGGV